MSVATAYRHLHADAVRLLSQWQPPDARQQRLRADYLTHLAAHPDGVAEAGLDGVRVLPRIAQLDRHTLVGAFGHCREHLDVRFAAVVPAGLEDAATASDESLDLRWWPLDGLPTQTADEVGQLACAALAVVQG